MLNRTSHNTVSAPSRRILNTTSHGFSSCQHSASNIRASLYEFPCLVIFMETDPMQHSSQASSGRSVRSRKMRSSNLRKTDLDGVLPLFIESYEEVAIVGGAVHLVLPLPLLCLSFTIHQVDGLRSLDEANTTQDLIIRHTYRYVVDETRYSRLSLIRTKRGCTEREHPSS